MGIYKKPENNTVHRGFVYLDDETVINSLSAAEAGQIDEVVAKINSAREGGFGGGAGYASIKVEGGKRSTSAFEEEVVRTRTRFSVFELWYQGLVEKKALGRFNGWGPDALDGVESGHTIELRAVCRPAPAYTMMHLYRWYADKAKSQGHPMSLKGEELKAVKEGERGFDALFEGNGDQVVLIATPLGEAGPKVAMPIDPQWLIGSLGSLGGEYTIVAQVDRLIAEGDEYPTIRLMQDVAPTPIEVQVMKEALGNFVVPSKELGIELSDNEATIPGPAVWLDPIAIFR
ncbi:hypothetical protein FB381_4007 [Nocardioides albertanoniae]|uniref:Uncharacterized protein n=1 Tax=Nocardioides albertanoniae TaxID=1175486 RepID=A0A543ABW2_9ACTN|nr:hypothetical protein [Nocardioides albertanoniae]TQL70081.1 hypothetical protein FB381_4007 [Nocardioides albertanoniae]